MRRGERSHKLCENASPRTAFSRSQAKIGLPVHKIWDKSAKSASRWYHSKPPEKIHPHRRTVAVVLEREERFHFLEKIGIGRQKSFQKRKLPAHGRFGISNGK